MSRHKPSPVAREDDFLSASDSSATDSDSDHGSERYTDARTASAVALPLSRQGTYKDDDGSLTASEDEKGAGRAASPRNNSFDLGSSDGESDEERLVGTGKRGASKSAKKKQKRSWVMRNVGDGTQQPGGGSSNTGIIVGILLVVLAIAIGGGVFLWKQGYLDSMTGGATTPSSVASSTSTATGLTAGTAAGGSTAASTGTNNTAATGTPGSTITGASGSSNSSASSSSSSSSTNHEGATLTDGETKDDQGHTKGGGAHGVKTITTTNAEGQTITTVEGGQGTEDGQGAPTGIVQTITTVVDGKPTTLTTTVKEDGNTLVGPEDRKRSLPTPAPLLSR